MPDLSTEDRAAVLAECDRFVARKPPGNLRNAGCALFGLGVLLLFGLPPFLGDKTQGEGGKKFLIGVTVVLLVAGLWLLVRGNRARRWARAGANEALTELRRFLVLAPGERAGAAVRLLLYAPGTGLRPEKLAADIPDALAYVLQVEALLVAERKTSPRLAGLR